jgi:hypothetical protein
MRRLTVLGLAYPNAFVRKISCYDEGNRTYPHRNLPPDNNHLPFENEPQRVSYRNNEKDYAGK